MTYDFSSMFSLYDTLNNVMYDYEEDGNENALQQFFHAATAVSPRSQPIGCFDVCEESDAVLEFVRRFYATTPCSGIDDCTDALYLQLEEKIGFSEAEQIDIPTIQRVLEAMDELFSFSRMIHPISISIIDAEMYGRNGESIAVFGNHCSGAIFLYRLWNNFEGKATPASVLLHELGHQLHFCLTGELYKVPESFYGHLENLGADYSDLSNEDLLEVFADTFLLAVIHKTKEFGDPYPEIRDTIKAHCYNYIADQFNGLHFAQI